MRDIVLKNLDGVEVQVEPSMTMTCAECGREAAIIGPVELQGALQLSCPCGYVYLTLDPKEE